MMAGAGVLAWAQPVLAETAATSAGTTSLQPAEFTGTVHSGSGQSYIKVAGERYELYFQNPSERDAIRDFDGQTVRVDGDIDLRWQPRRNVLWVDRMVAAAPETDYEITRREARRGYVNPADDEPVGDSHFRGKDVLDMPFRGPESPSLVPRLHLRW